VRRAEAPGGGVREPDKGLVEVIALRRAGRAREADQALAEFRKAWPDYPLPSALRPAP
jgi:hypothetical protein